MGGGGGGGGINAELDGKVGTVNKENSKIQDWEYEV